MTLESFRAVWGRSWGLLLCQHHLMPSTLLVQVPIDVPYPSWDVGTTHHCHLLSCGGDRWSPPRLSIEGFLLDSGGWGDCWSLPPHFPEELLPGGKGSLLLLPHFNVTGLPSCEGGAITLFPPWGVGCEIVPAWWGANSACFLLVLIGACAVYVSPLGGASRFRWVSCPTPFSRTLLGR